MKTTVQYLEEVKAARGLTSDYQLAKALHVGTSSIVQYRNGRSALGIETSMIVGEILGIDGHAVYAQGQIERAKNAQQSAFWLSISEKFSESFKALIRSTAPRHSPMRIA